MVKHAHRLLLTVAALACLGACNVGVSIFPDRFLHSEAYTDLSGYIDQDRAWGYDFKIIRDSDSGVEYLVLVNDASFDGVHLVVFNTSLRVLGKFTRQDLDALDAAPWEGRGAMVDASGRIVVGNRRFTVESGTLVYKDTPPTLWDRGLAIPDAPTPNLANIHGDTYNLAFDQCSLPWDASAPVSLQISESPWHKIAGAWLTDTEVVLVVRHGTGTSVLAMDDKLAFAAGSLCTPLLPTYGTGSVPDPDNLDWEKFGYTKDGFAAYFWDTNQYLRFDEAGNTVSTLEVEKDSDRPYDQRHVYGQSSGWYILDLKDRYLERCRWWWK
jgi:hypothetical protein